MTQALRLAGWIVTAQFLKMHKRVLLYQIEYRVRIIIYVLNNIKRDLNAPPPVWLT